MGTATIAQGLSYAASGFAAYSGLARRVRQFLGNVDGATAIEYAMIASIVSVVIFAGVQTIGQKVTHFFAEVVAPNV